MISKKENLLGALVKLINASIKLEALEKAEKEHLEAHGLKPEDVERTSYNEAVEDLSKLHDEFNKIFEDAKHNITADLSKNEISLLDKIEISDEDAAQQFYINEIFFDLAYIVNRSNQIRPLFVVQDIPLAIERKYREAVLCCIYGRFDACCIMCRAIVEMMLRKLCRDKFKSPTEFDGDSFQKMMDSCRKFNLLSAQCLDLAEKIRVKGNSSIHAENSATEEDAIEAINNTQGLLQIILRGKKYFNRTPSN